MNILLLSDFSSTHTRKWGEALVREGCTVGIFSLNPATDDWHDRHGIRAFSAGIPPSTSKGRLVSKIRYLFCGGLVRKAIRSFKPDILHAHYASSYGLLARRSNMPYLLSVWGSDVFEFPNQNPLNRRIIVESLNRATRVLATGKALAKEVRGLCGRDATIIPFGIDTKKFRPEHCERGDRPFTFIIVKPLEPWYGIDLAINALGQLDRSVRLVIAGQGSEEAHLKEMARSMHIEERIDFLGFVDHDRVPEVLNGADCFLNLSRRESFGVAILEAMACGLPVIATRSHGAEELIETGTDGLLVPIDGLSETVDAMKAVMKDEPKRKTMAENGLSKVREHYDWEDCVRQMIQTYRDVVP